MSEFNPVIAILEALREHGELTAHQIALRSGVPHKLVYNTIRHHLRLGVRVDRRTKYYRMLSEEEHQRRSRAGHWKGVT